MKNHKTSSMNNSDPFHNPLLPPLESSRIQLLQKEHEAFLSFDTQKIIDPQVV